MNTFRYRAMCLVTFALASSSALASRPVQIVSEPKSAKYWAPADSLTDPGYPEGAHVGDVCVNIGYYLGEDGRTSEFAHLKSWSDQGAGPGRPQQSLAIFEQTAVAALQRRRFVPLKAKKPRPMYTSTTFVFSADQGSDKTRLRNRCAIADLKDFVAKAQAAADPVTWNQIRWNGDWFSEKRTRVHGLARE